MTNKILLSKKAFLGAAFGTMVEYYDYALFSLFLPIIAPLFFPADSAYHSLVKSYFLILLAMIARPFGGALFGYLGDVFGRPKALLTSMYGIALSSFVLGILPTYSTIGVWAIVIILLAKTIQAACFGGEYNGAGIYVVEHATTQREGWAGGLLSAIMLCGGLAASFIGILLTYPFMPNWSWRIAFILGGFLGIVGILYRKNLTPSPHFIPANLKQHSFITLVKKFPEELLAGIFIGGIATALYTTVILVILPILTTKGYLTTHQFMWIVSVLNLFAVLTLMSAGSMADRISPIRVMRFACLLLVIFSYPLLSIIDKGNLFITIIAMIGIIAINEIFLGPSNAYLKSIFPMQFRYRGSSISFCIGMSLLGGLTPIIDNYLYHISGKFSLIACWLIFLGLGALISLERVRRKHHLTLASLTANPASLS